MWKTPKTKVVLPLGSDILVSIHGQTRASDHVIEAMS